MSDNIRVNPESKTSPNLRKLARALLLLAEQKAEEAKTAAERQWAEQFGDRQPDNDQPSDDSKGSAA
jgi:hypothetical protein